MLCSFHVVVRRRILSDAQCVEFATLSEVDAAALALASNLSAAYRTALEPGTRVIVSDEAGEVISVVDLARAASPPEHIRHGTQDRMPTVSRSS